MTINLKLKSMYNENFVKLVEESTDETYIGRGNPNSKILFVGKEYSRPNTKGEFDARYWKEKIAQNKKINLTHTKEVGIGHTWNKYQDLHDYIFEKPKTNIFDFEETIFTTEMSDIPQEKTSNARKNSEFKLRLIKRKNEFFKSDFILNFPVIVLACSGYIRNDDNIREIDDIFSAYYKDEYEKKIYTKFNWFYSHYNEDQTRLVIHTRQLSGNVKTELLKDMGGVIRKHLKVNGFIV